MGRRIKLAGVGTRADPVSEPSCEIVGVVADVTNSGLEAPVQPEIWIPYTVTGSGTQVLMVRSEQTPMSLMNAVRQAVWATDVGVALALPGALEDQIGRASCRERG